MNKHKISTYVLIGMISLILIVIVTGVQEGDSPEDCANGELIWVSEGVWKCTNTTSMNLTVNVEVVMNDPCANPNVYCHQINTAYGIVYLNFSSIHNGTFTYKVET